jgi:RNA polymerase sigma-70 factor (ECF subfamily)
MVKLRLDRRLRGRVDASDVLQEAFMEAAERIEQYLREPTMPPFLWLRFITGQRLLRIHRQHLGVQGRDAAREVSLYRGALPSASSAALAAQLVGKRSTPSKAAARAETKVRLQEALNRLEELDREVLALRHFEQLSNAEIALVLGIQESAASKRYIRALERLKDQLRKLPGGLEDLVP